jgi:protein ImuB
MLWLGLYFPNLPLEVYTRASAATHPLIVCDGPGREREVLRANSAAARRGIEPGMRASAALALANDLKVVARDPKLERHALHRLAAWAGQFSSLVHPVAQHTLLLEVGGSLRLFRDLENLLTQVELGLAELGFEAQCAVAPTKLAASWLSRTGHDAQITDAASLASAVGELPLSVLDLAPTLLARLKGMGVTRVGDCMRLPRDGLARRLGLAFVQQLDQALGRMPDPRAPFVPPATFDSRLELPGAVENVESLVFALNRLVAELCGELRARTTGVRALSLTLTHPRAAASTIELRLTALTRDPKHFIELFRERLARIELAEPVEALALRAAELLPLGTPTIDLFTPRQASEEFAAALIERLRARLGEKAVVTVDVVPEHRPERAYRYSAPPVTQAPMKSGERPFWILPEPVPLRQVDDQPWIGSALNLEGRAERIESGWWDEADIGRDYFVARNRSGECYWVFRETQLPRRWWLHGIFG